ncbi:GntR family transcriptional regulator [Collinsella vaginalis]|uniref:GntR family transcriptional regulator n=1 Tax=Collinsella vaginalis TaxID=1870987 RepID=UPI000A270237|nr:GntR family transcriptional regulator [Collinsella vaginalis]
MNANSAIPLYKQIVRYLDTQIKAGIYGPGDKLPTENELMEKFGVSRITVRSAVKELEDAGIVVRVRAKGTFVSSDRDMYAADDRESFSCSCRMAGKEPSTRLLSLEWVYPNLRDRKFFHIEEDESILKSRRLRFVDGEPTMLETNSYGASLAFLEHENLEGSIFEILNARCVALGSNLRTVEVCYATKLESTHLGVKEGSALLLFVDRWHDEYGEPLFISRQVYCTERLKFYL